ncbi:MAG: type IV secretory system conjugative DNA transfer family protein [Planctomycetes bacterium]|nr:type IV secretory system conjugative DNA transfer family protein [Planctomycetota bacterium]
MKKFLNFMVFIASIAVAYYFAPAIWYHFGYRADWFGYVSVFIGSAILIKIFIFIAFPIWNWRRNKKAANKHEDRKFNENVSLRIVKGSFINIFVIPPILCTLAFLVWQLSVNIVNILSKPTASRIVEVIPYPYSETAFFTEFTLKTPLKKEVMFVPILFLAAFVISFHYSLIGSIFNGWPDAKELIGGLVIKLTPRRFKHGRGGSAGFGGIFDDWAARYKSGMILIGASLYEPLFKFLLNGMTYKIGCKDDLHLITVASNRSGKGRSAIIPNLIEWPHSALVIDPKGTNAAVTALRRGSGGARVKYCKKQNVHIVDPFKTVTKCGPLADYSACFNPLDMIDINSSTVTEDIGMVADAMILQEGGNYGVHFMEGAQSIIAGITAHLLTKNEKATLIDVRKALTQEAEGLEELFSEMITNDKAGGLPIVAASLLENAGNNERGAFLTTVTRNTKWIDSLSMQEVLGNSSFKMSDLKNGKTTVYIVLPPHMLDEHKRFLRLFVNMSILGMSKGERAEETVLFILDEFFSLGHLAQLEKAAGLLASYKVKLWPIVQNISQIKQNYPKNWETFFANAGISQFFAVSDLETQKYLQQRLSKTAYGGVVTNLRETSELEEEIGRDAKRQIILRAGKKPLLLRRTNYDAIYSKNMYSPDPDHPKS